MLDLLLTRDDGLGIGHSDDEAVELDPHRAYAAGASLDTCLAEAGAGGGAWKVDGVADGFPLAVAS